MVESLTIAAQQVAMETMDILKLGALQKLIIMETTLENREIGGTVNKNVKMVLHNPNYVITMETLIKMEILFLTIATHAHAEMDQLHVQRNFAVLLTAVATVGQVVTLIPTAIVKNL